MELTLWVIMNRIYRIINACGEFGFRFLDSPDVDCNSASNKSHNNNNTNNDSNNKCDNTGGF